MNIMVTGDRGYIGSVVFSLLQNGYNVIGFDSDYYRGCDLFQINREYRQITKDIRSIVSDDIKDIDAIIHLAALSNDPRGNCHQSYQRIILRERLNSPNLARDAGVQRFNIRLHKVMYGISSSD